jgi:sarcosine oxidase
MYRSDHANGAPSVASTSSIPTCDTVVIGLGGIGSATLYRLARRLGSQVLGIEQFDLGHPYGGSQDHSRIIRLMYHDARYTALTPSTYTAWAEVEEESGLQLVVKTGGVEIAAPDYAHDIDRYAAAMDAASIPYERFGADELRRRYPQFAVQDDVSVLYQPSSGLVNAAHGMAAHLALARAHGARIRTRCRVLALEPQGDSVRVRTSQGDVACRRVVVCAASWTNEVIGSTGFRIPLTVTQEQVTYYSTPHLREFAPGRFPIFIWKDRLDVYGFPVYGEVATKAGIDAAGAVVTPESRSMEPDPANERALSDWLATHIPRFVGPTLYSKTCLYDMPPDREFIVDHLPEQPAILVCVGAGHAYKFAALLGRLLNEMALDGRASLPVEGFTLNRPAIQDPAFEATFHI